MRKKRTAKGARIPKTACKRQAAKPAVIAYRKRCQATGTGLSHYVLLGREAKA